MSRELCVVVVWISKSLFDSYKIDDLSLTVEDLFPFFYFESDLLKIASCVLIDSW